MAEYTNVKVSVEDNVAILTIDHPPANAFNRATLNDLEAAFDDCVANDQVKAIIITGAGQFAFVAGADINELAQIKGPEDAASFCVKARICSTRLSVAPNR